MLVLLLEDDHTLATQTISFLEHEQIDVDYVSTLSQVAHVLKETQFDAIVLDMHLPDGSALSLIEQGLINSQTPTLFLTANHKLDSKLAAFEAGALDYITKPFALAELTAWLKILTKKKSSKINKQFHINDLTVDFDAKIAQRGARILSLSPQQSTLLTLLCDSSPNPISKFDILNHIWPEQDVNNNMYKLLLTRLRKNLTQMGERELLVTLKGQGGVLRSESSLNNGEQLLWDSQPI